MTRSVRGKWDTKSNNALKRSWTGVVFLTFFIVAYNLLQIPDPSFQEQHSGLIPALHQNVHKSPIQFILFLGIEGTGHHFWQDLIKESPIHAEIQEYGLHPAFTKRLTQTLYRHKKARWKGLWSSPCKWQDTDPTPNITLIYEELVATLDAMKARVTSDRNARSIGDTEPVSYPVNFLAAGDEFGVISYPSFLKPCRALQYPNLDLWYAACDRAAVQCNHVYIYRDPYSVIHSTVDNRNINKDKLEAIHLYTTQLQILYSQLASFQKRLVACWEYESALSPLQWAQEINPILKFSNPHALGRTIQQIFRPRPMLTDVDRDRIVPAEFSLYMDSFVRMHNATVQFCKALKSKHSS